MKLDNNLKNAINVLQNYLVQSYESDYVLLIFDNQAELLKYKRKKNYMCPNEILRTIDELCNYKYFDGLRFKRYFFMMGDDENV